MADAPEGAPRLILVAGMHRSGTSLLAHLLWRAGAHLGGPLDTAPLDSNETGHWEHAEVVAVQEALLADLGRVWHLDGDLPLPEGWEDWPESQAALLRLSAIAGRELAGRDHWAVKDPRSTQFLPLWQAVARRQGAALRVVLALRDPRAVAASLLRRNGMEPVLAGAIWREHHRALLAAAPAALYVQDYDALVADPRAALPPLLAFCGLPLPTDLAATAAGVLPARRHHPAGSVDLPPLPAALADLHGALLRGDAAPPPPPEVSAPQQEVLVVMRTAWRPTLLRRALRSVLSQSHAGWHLHLVNDGGPPVRLEQALAPYRPLFAARLTVSHLLPAVGMEAASNHAIAGGRGAFIAIHDDDDSWRPRFLEAMLAFLAARAAPAGVCRSILVRERMTAAGMQAVGIESFGPSSETVSVEALALENRFPPIALLCRREAVERLGGYRAEMPVLGDWEFNLRLAALGPIPVLPAELARWHRRPADDALPNSLDGEHRRYTEAIARHRRQGDPAAPVTLESEVLALPPPAVATAWNAPAGRPLAVQAAHEVEPGPGPGEWQATGHDPRLILRLRGEPLPAGLHLLRFVLRTPEGEARPQLFHSATGEENEIDSLRLAQPRDGRHALLLNLRRPHLRLRLDPMEGPGALHLAQPTLLALGPPQPGFRRLGQQARLPDFLCIGAQRAGTTWLHQALAALPGVWLPPMKELHYFDHAEAPEHWDAFRARQAVDLLLRLRDPAQQALALDHGFGGPPTDGWYSRRFDGAPPGALLGEVTPAYATLDDAGIARVLALLPDVRVLLLLRDPVQRSLSGALHALRHAGQAITAEAVAAAVEAPDNRARSDYRGIIERWSAALPPGRLGLFFHDDLLAAPAQTLARIAGFLGLPPPADIAVPRGRINGIAGERAGLDLAAITARLSQALLPDLRWLAARLGGAAQQWLRTAECRLAVAAAPAPRDRRTANLLQWDRDYAWPQGGDEWQGQARADGHDYAAWKLSVERELIGAWLPAGGRLLEIGPGHGRWTGALAGKSRQLVLVDVSPACLDHCRDRFAGTLPLRCHLGAGADLPADLTAAVDGIWSFDALVHVAPDDLRRYLHEIARVLRPGGVALLHHAGRRHWSLPLAGLVRRGLLPARAYRWLSVGLDDGGDGWRSEVSPMLVRRWAADAGLVVVAQLRRWGPGGRFGLPRHRDRVTVLRRP